MPRALVLVSLVLLLLGCRKDERAEAPPAAPSARSSSTTLAASAPSPEPPLGDAEKGKTLVAKFQCNRCHEGTGFEKPALDQDCVRCHQEIHAGTYQASATSLAKWQKSIVHFRETPSLANIGGRLRRGFLEKFLLEPHDVRPHLDTTMPRLAITPEEARDVAAWLTSSATPAPAVALEGASVEKGSALFEAKGCRQCHEYTGAPRAALPAGVADLEGKGERMARALAPDLRYVRERMAPGELVRWLDDPKAQKPDTLMPKTPLTPDEQRDLSAFLLRADLAPKVAKIIPPRLPVLDRKVTYDEVSRRVFRNTCWHCHAEPDYAIGDGGPGNTGGFGYRPRGLNLAEYEGIQAGYVDDKGERRSIFSPMPDGTPRLVYAMLARYREEAGQTDPVVRGMPLALPPVTPEDIQLVETWIAQGRPQ
ncbi:c-type cytochrome [Polyangium fumosum]|uniref:C-type cytochrome n=1 Tax=Polyangium fumosum TaxID=889272 RepID=A0A4U1IX13_9BACT|nr:c-type cytochrome [Polyangium fumosum]TKC98720.1 c-type cytochrome [Polyangium fumosum]